ncbi:hypothetical protein U9M48_028171 [Paspalum notatum var. saurae]|uniref:Transmembrane protein n=1 Tax=Paspalum notatum var. saurae TaxID=547442 RepID=A0AAQ3TUI8_PASNO
MAIASPHIAVGSDDHGSGFIVVLVIVQWGCVSIVRVLIWVFRINGWIFWLLLGLLLRWRRRGFGWLILQRFFLLLFSLFLLGQVRDKLFWSSSSESVRSTHSCGDGEGGVGVGNLILLGLP